MALAGTNKPGKNIAEGLAQLPAFPNTLLDLLQTVRNERLGVRAVSTVLQSDPALTGNVLRLANSVIYGGGQKLDSVTAAVSRIGIQRVADLANAIWLKGALPKTLPFYDETATTFLAHSVATGMLAEKLAIAANLPNETAFTSGLLHDVGKLAVVARGSARILGENLVPEPGESILQAERRLLGIDHAEIGADLGTRWNFPAMVVQSIRLHHSLPVGDAVGLQLARVIHIASLLDRHVMSSMAQGAASGAAMPVAPPTIEGEGGVPVPLLDPQLIGPLGLDEARIMTIADGVLAETKAIIDALG